MEQHEKTHLQDSCEHKNLRYSLDTQEDDGFIDAKIECKCKDCLLQIDVKLPTYNQEELAKIFEAVGGLKLMHERKIKIQKAKERKEKMQADFEVKYGRKMTNLETLMFLT